MKYIPGLLVIFIAWPISFYLWYNMLKLVGASELMWFLFWAYVPAVLLASIIGVIAQEQKK